MSGPALPLTLPYATSVERDFARARLIAALVTGLVLGVYVPILRRTRDVSGPAEV